MLYAADQRESDYEARIGIFEHFVYGIGLYCIQEETRHEGMTMNVTEHTPPNLLDRLLAPIGDCLTPEVAEKLVNLRADTMVQARLEELAAKSTEGTLTDAERAEYDSYIHTLDVLAVLQAKARGVLKAHGSA